MENIDLIQINFDENKLFLLNICLAILMFAVSLDIELKDFKKYIYKPKPLIVGLISQLILLPFITVILIYFLNPPASVALGMILVASCPGGNVSNFIVFLAKANTSLSILMTSISTLASIILTPVLFGFWANMNSSTASLLQSIEVDPFQILKVVATLILIPVIIGMTISYKFPSLAAKIRKPMKSFSMLLFIGLIVVALLGNIDNIKIYLKYVFFIVLIHNFLAFSQGYIFSRINGLSIQNARTISIETGIQNSGLGLIIIFSFFNGLGGMALVAAWWGIWHLIAGFTLGMVWGNKPINRH